MENNEKNFYAYAFEFNKDRWDIKSIYEWLYLDNSLCDINMYLYSTKNNRVIYLPFNSKLSYIKKNLDHKLYVLDGPIIWICKISAEDYFNHPRQKFKRNFLRFDDGAIINAIGLFHEISSILRYTKKVTDNNNGLIPNYLHDEDISNREIDNFVRSTKITDSELKDLFIPSLKGSGQTY